MRRPAVRQSPVGHQGPRLPAPAHQTCTYRQPLIGTCYLLTVIDDHSRVAYIKTTDDEIKETATTVLRNAVAWFADRGVTVRRVLSAKTGGAPTAGPTPPSARLHPSPCWTTWLEQN